MRSAASAGVGPGGKLELLCHQYRKDPDPSAVNPFQFNVGDRTLPAGEYSVAQVNPSSDRAVLQLRSKDGGSSATIQMNNVIGKAPKRAKLVFNRYGNQYYFAAAWIDGDTSGLQAQKSRAERATEREHAALKASRELVEVAAR